MIINTMKKAYSRSTLVFFALLIVIGLGQAARASYQEPTAAAPGNAAEPINSSDDAQVKQGGLSVYAFTARMSAEFDYDYNRFDGLLRGGTPGDVNSQVHIGGILGSQDYNNDLKSNGLLNAAGYIQSTDLSHSDNTLKPLCADTAGKIIFCPDGAASTYTIELDVTSGLSSNNSNSPQDAFTQIDVTDLTTGQAYTITAPDNTGTMSATLGDTYRLDAARLKGGCNPPLIFDVTPTVGSQFIIDQNHNSQIVELSCH